MSAIEELLQVMRDLRHPEHGCPWDLRQTSASIAAYTLDETHELLDAIDSGDTDNLKEELGDLLFNIVFHARIAEERGQFNFDDVARGIADKMRRRHPHVFGELQNEQLSDEELAKLWRESKRKEKTNGNGAPLAAGSKVASPMFRARELQKDAAKLGFDWPDIEPVFDKLQEEIEELRHAFRAGNRDAIGDELGDVIFVCVNIARHAGINAEMSLRGTNAKFVRRFEYVQRQMQAAGIEMQQKQLDEMEKFWQEAKGKVG